MTRQSTSCIGHTCTDLVNRVERSVLLFAVHWVSRHTHRLISWCTVFGGLLLARAQIPKGRLRLVQDTYTLTSSDRRWWCVSSLKVLVRTLRLMQTIVIILSTISDKVATNALVLESVIWTRHSNYASKLWWSLRKFLGGFSFCVYCLSALSDSINNCTAAGIFRSSTNRLDVHALSCLFVRVLYKLLKQLVVLVVRHLLTLKLRTQ